MRTLRAVLLEPYIDVRRSRRVRHAAQRPRRGARSRGADARGLWPSSPTCTAASTSAPRAAALRGGAPGAASTPASCPTSCAETAAVRDGDWTVAPIPADLQDRRVEITGPVDRKMIVNALNSGAKVFMADFEDATSPTWANLDRGPDQPQGPLGRRASTSRDRRPARTTSSTPSPAVLMVRPRGWHLPEEHLDSSTASRSSGALFDFGLYFFHNAQGRARARHAAPFLPAQAREPSRGAALERGLRPRRAARSACPSGTIKATVLIETLPAAFEMDEILYELRDHMAGLNCGRWDYIFSFIKTLAQQARLPAARPRRRWSWARPSCAPIRCC